MPYGSLQVWTEEWDGVPVIGAEGEIDLGTVDQFRQTTRDVVGQHPKSLIFDLRKVSYIDSTGLGVLVAARRKLASTPEGVVILSGQPSVLQSLRITGLDRIFKVMEDPSALCPLRV